MASDTGNARWLTVSAGVHLGATSALEAGAAVLVGGAHECDVCLADDGVAPHHALLMVDDHGLRVRALDDGLRLDGRPLRRGRIRTWPLGAALSMGGATLVLEQASPNDASVTVARRPRAPWRVALCVGAGVVSLMALAMQGVDLGDGVTDPATRTPALAELIDERGLGESLHLDRSGPHPILRGVLTRDERDTLIATLRHAGIDAALDVTLVTELLGQVGDVFRTNGYRAELRFVPPAGVRVDNLDASNPGVARAADHVRRDVPALTSLLFAPADDPGPDADAPALADLAPDKRLTTIVDGATAYVAAADGSRYFIGSVLPGGAQVRQITRDGVQVDREGVLTWLRF